MEEESPDSYNELTGENPNHGWVSGNLKT